MYHCSSWTTATGKFEAMLKHSTPSISTYPISPDNHPLNIEDATTLKNPLIRSFKGPDVTKIPPGPLHTQIILQEGSKVNWGYDVPINAEEKYWGPWRGTHRNHWSGLNRFPHKALQQHSGCQCQSQYIRPRLRTVHPSNPHILSRFNFHWLISFYLL